MKKEEAFYKTDSSFRVNGDGSLQLTTYFSHDNYSPDSKKKLFHLRTLKKFERKKLKKE